MALCISLGHCNVVLVGYYIETLVCKLCTCTWLSLSASIDVTQGYEYHCFCTHNLDIHAVCGNVQKHASSGLLYF